MNERYYVVERRFRCGRVSCRDCGCLVVDRLSHDIFHRRLERVEKGLPVEEVLPLDTSFPAPSVRQLRDLGWWRT